MTIATPWTTDPPSGRPTEQAAAEDGEPPARVRLLTMHSTSRLHRELFARLRDSSYDLRPIANWEQFLRDCERLSSGAVLLDLDEAERSPGLRQLGLSAHRLGHLLARDLNDKAAALVVLTARDYAEIEDLMRAGVHALLHPRSGRFDVDWCVEQVRVAVARRQALCERRRAGCEQQRDTALVSPGHDTQTRKCKLALVPPAVAEPLIVFHP